MYLESAGEGSHEPSGMCAKHSFVGCILNHFALVDLADLDVGESGIIVEASVTDVLAEQT